MTRTGYVPRLIGPLSPIAETGGPAALRAAPHQPRRPQVAALESTLFAGGGPAEPGGAGGARSMMRQP